MGITLQFLGASGTVTGSRYLLEIDGRHILLDCGLFQGWKPLRLRNWTPFPVDPESLDAVVLSHAHLDHSGYLPLLTKSGFRGRVYCTPATRDLWGILLPDSGHLQEEEAKYANRHRYSKHTPALPLYTEDDARRALDRLTPLRYGQAASLGERTTLRLHRAGHILGAAIVEIEHAGRRLVFSGDLGRPNDLIVREPTILEAVDWLLVESTYGDRVHDRTDPRAKLGEVIRRVAAKGGVVMIPTFAVGRAQSLLYMIHTLKATKALPPVPVYLNSPMAIDATEIWHQHRDEHRLTPEECEAMCHAATLVNTADESRALNLRKGPMVILAASGMATGGRILHHLKAFVGDARNAVLFSGFQAGGTRGAALLAGAPFIKIHGEQFHVRARVEALDNVSAHADSTEIMGWLAGFKRAPRHTFVVHGEPAAADALRRRIQDERGWPVSVPEHLQTVTLT